MVGYEPVFSLCCLPDNSEKLCIMGTEYMSSLFNYGSKMKKNIRLMIIKYVGDLRSNLCLWSAPTQYNGRERPRKHGDKFKLNDRSTWWSAKSS